MENKEKNIEVQYTNIRRLESEVLELDKRTCTSTQQVIDLIHFWNKQRKEYKTDLITGGSQEKMSSTNNL